MRAQPKTPFPLRRDAQTGRHCCPSEAEAAVLSASELDALHAWLDAELVAEYEASPGQSMAHTGAIIETLDRLGGHFKRVGKGIFLASELAVHYPDEPVFAPDVLAVRDVPLHDRASWRVDVEGKGPDLVLEVLVDGDRRKDLQFNVARLARLGVPEYLVFDVRSARVVGWRLTAPGSRTYVPIVPQFGRIPSETLQLEFGVVDGRIRCWRDGAELPLAEQVIALLGKVLDEKDARLAEVLALQEQESARAQAESARAQAESARAQAESARAQAESARARAALRRSILRTLTLRGLLPDAAQRAHIEDCEDAERLEDWDARVLDIGSVEALLAD